MRLRTGLAKPRRPPCPRDGELRFAVKQEFADAIQHHAKSKGLQVGVTFDGSSTAVSYLGSNTSIVLEQLSPAELDAVGWDHDNEPCLIMQPRLGASYDIVPAQFMAGSKVRTFRLC